MNDPSNREPERAGLPARIAATAAGARRGAGAAGGTHAPAQLLVQLGGESTPSAFPLTGDVVRIGRGGENDVVIDAPFVSRDQAVLRIAAAGCTLEPVPGALTPVVYRGRMLDGPVTLRELDYFRLPGETPGELVTCIYMAADAVPAGLADARRVALVPGRPLLIGSREDNDIGAGSALLAPRHAELERVGERVVLRDLGAGTTQVDGVLVTGAVDLPSGSRVSAGDVRITVDGTSVEYRRVSGVFAIGARRARLLPDELLARVDATGGVELEARNLRRAVRGGVTILDDVSLHIRPRELVALVGLSGAGKSTLLNALTGFRPADAGEVLIDGVSLYDHRDRFRSAIGYVPQRDIVHAPLTVFEALDYAARLRLPPDTPETERHARIEQVIADLGLTARRDARVAHLSGGQIKRVSIGVELISRPQLLFLDEPTSGLDPATETGLMQLLRRLADQGRTVVVITHATKNVTLADRVIFMVPGGRVAWFGPPGDALDYFERHRPESERRDRPMEFDEIYRVLEDPARGSAAEWAERYRGDPAHQRYVAEPLGWGAGGAGGADGATTAGVAGAGRERAGGGGGLAAVRTPSWWRQLITLSGRNARLLARDRFALVLIIVAAPALASLDFLIAKRGMFDPLTGDAGRIVVTTNAMIVNAMLVGALAQMREIIKDRDIYRRERLVNLGILPYVLSKVWIALALAAYQAACWVGIRYLAVDMPGGWHVASEFYVTMALATFCGMMLGLLASAAAPSEDAVALIVALLIVPQVLFSGAHLPVHQLSPLVRSQTAIMPSRWAFEVLVSAGGHGADVAHDECWAGTTREQRALMPSSAKSNCTCLGPNLFELCDFPAIRSFQVTSVPEGFDLVEAQRTATSLAEGRLEVDYDAYGPVYDVHVASRWLPLAAIGAGLAALILAIQRLRERVR